MQREGKQFYPILSICSVFMLKQTVRIKNTTAAIHVKNNIIKYSKCINFAILLLYQTIKLLILQFIKTFLFHVISLKGICFFMEISWMMSSFVHKKTTVTLPQPNGPMIQPLKTQMFEQVV